MRALISRVATVASVLGLAWFLWSTRDDLAELSFTSTFGLVAMTAGLAINLTASHLLNYRLLRQISIGVDWREALATTWIGTLLNSVLPARAGTAYRAAYFRAHHSASLAVFSASVLGYLLVTVAIGSAATLLVLRGPAFEARDTGVVDVVALSMLAGSVLVALTARIRALSDWKPTSRFAGASRMLVERPAQVARIGALGATQVGSSIVALWGAVEMIGGTLPFSSAIAIGAVGTMSTLVALTPGSLGIYEATVGATAAVLAIPASTLVAAALTQRIALVLLLVIGLPAARRLLGR